MGLVKVKIKIILNYEDSVTITFSKRIKEGWLNRFYPYDNLTHIYIPIFNNNECTPKQTVIELREELKSIEIIQK